MIKLLLANKSCKELRIIESGDITTSVFISIDECLIVFTRNNKIIIPRIPRALRNFIVVGVDKLASALVADVVEVVEEERNLLLNLPVSLHRKRPFESIMADPKSAVVEVIRFGVCCVSSFPDDPCASRRNRMAMNCLIIVCRWIRLF